MKQSDLQLWNTETGQPIGSPLPTTGYVSTLQFSPDSHHLLTFGGKAINLWDTATGSLERPSWKGNLCDTAALSPDGKSVAFQDENSLYRCDIDGTHLQVLVANSVEMVKQLAFTRDGKRLTSVWQSWNDTPHPGAPNENRLEIQQWDANSGRPVTRPRHTNAIQELNGRDGDWYITVSRDNTVQKWDSETGIPIGVSIRLLDDHGDRMQGIAVSSDGARMAATSYGEQKTLVWDMLTGQPVGLPVQYRNQTGPVHLSPDGSRMALYDAIRGVVRVWQVTGSAAFQLPVKMDPVTVSAFSPDGSRFAVYAINTGVQLWNALTGEKLGLPIQIIHESNGKFMLGAHDAAGIMRRPLQFSSDGKLLAVMSGDLTVQIVAADSGLPVGPPMLNNGYVEAFAFRADGKQLAVAITNESGSGTPATWNGSVQLWDTAAGNPVGARLESGFPVYGLEYSADGKQLIATSSSSKRRIWDMNTLRAIDIGDKEAADFIHAPFAEFQPGGKALATYSQDNTTSPPGVQVPVVSIWGGADWTKLQRTLRIQIVPVPSQEPIIGFSPNGKWLASAQYGYRDHNGLILWSTDDWRPKEISLPDTSQVIDAKYSSDGKWLAVAAEDSTELQSGAGADKWMVKLLNLSDGRVNSQILQQYGSYMAMSFLPDGNLQVAGYNRNFARLWKLPTLPVDNDTMELRTWIALGAKLDENKQVEMLSPADWRKLQLKLK